jgi:phosphohistidine swiveling domain-containing protein
VWTPLFAVAGAVVTEVGGILSHGAIVAREYGIPAVLSVAGATKHVQEGQRITVDGNRGIVLLETGGAAC